MRERGHLLYYLSPKLSLPVPVGINEDSIWSSSVGARHPPSRGSRVEDGDRAGPAPHAQGRSLDGHCRK